MAMDPKETTMHNHKRIGTDGKPLISNLDFRKLCDAAKIVTHLRKNFSMTMYQDDLVKDILNPDSINAHMYFPKEYE